VQLGVRMYAFTLYAVWAFTGKTFITFDCWTRDLLSVVSGLKSPHAELARLTICNSADVGLWRIRRQCSTKLLFHYDVKLTVRTYFIRIVGWVEWRVNI